MTAFAFISGLQRKSFHCQDMGFEQKTGLKSMANKLVLSCSFGLSPDRVVAHRRRQTEAIVERDNGVAHSKRKKRPHE
jgi:hypothetical protein